MLRNLVAAGCLLSGLVLSGCHNQYHDSVIQTVRANRGDLQACVDDATRRNPAINGEIELAMQIGPDGRVMQAKFTKDEVHDSALQGCVVQRATAWQLPPPPGGRITVERYNFNARHR